MSGFGHDTSTLTLTLTLASGTEIRVIGSNDGVNGFEWSANIANPGGDPELVPVPIEVSEETLIDGITPACPNCGGPEGYPSDHAVGCPPEARGPLREYTATFSPEAWVNDVAIPVDPEGETEWDCTAFVDEATLAYLEDCAERHHGRLDDPIWGVLDNDDVFKHDPAAPEWVREWRGPFTIRIRRIEDE